MEMAKVLRRIISAITHHIPVPLKEKYTVSYLFDVSIALPLRYEDNDGSPTRFHWPVYCKRGLGASRVWLSRMVYSRSNADGECGQDSVKVAEASALPQAASNK